MPLATDEQVTFAELLEDPIYSAWLRKIPKSTSPCYSGKPWRVWVQRRRGGPWSRRDFAKYAEAYNFAMHHYKQFHDLAINCKVDAHKPPVVSRGGKRGTKERYLPGKPGMHHTHQWCVHCRRPTIFTWFSRHHNLGRIYRLGEIRCVICGTGDIDNRKAMRGR